MVNPQPTSEPKCSQVEAISVVGELNTVHVCVPCLVCIPIHKLLTGKQGVSTRRWIAEGSYHPCPCLYIYLFLPQMYVELNRC